MSGSYPIKEVLSRPCLTMQNLVTDAAYKVAKRVAPNRFALYTPVSPRPPHVSAGRHTILDSSKLPFRQSPIINLAALERDKMRHAQDFELGYYMVRQGKVPRQELLTETERLGFRRVKEAAKDHPGIVQLLTESPKAADLVSGEHSRLAVQGLGEIIDLARRNNDVAEIMSRVIIANYYNITGTLPPGTPQVYGLWQISETEAHVVLE